MEDFNCVFGRMICTLCNLEDYCKERKKKLPHIV